MQTKTMLLIVAVFASNFLANLFSGAQKDCSLALACNILLALQWSLIVMPLSVGAVSRHHQEPDGPFRVVDGPHRAGDGPGHAEIHELFSPPMPMPPMGMVPFPEAGAPPVSYEVLIPPHHHHHHEQYEYHHPPPHHYQRQPMQHHYQPQSSPPMQQMQSQQSSQQQVQVNQPQLLSSLSRLQVFPFVIDPLLVIAGVALPVIGMLGLSSLIMPLIPLGIYLINLFFPAGSGSGGGYKVGSDTVSYVFTNLTDTTAS